MMTDSRGINLIGHLGTNLGLGVAARTTARTLADRGDNFGIIDIPTATIRPTRLQEFEDHQLNPTAPAPYFINLFHMNPPEILSEIRMRPTWIGKDDRIHAIVPFWELSSLPVPWHDLMLAMDVVLAPTRFVADVVEHSIEPREMVHFPQTAFLPEGIHADRNRWGFGEREVVFVTSFDINSDPARKNPFGAVKAFEIASRTAPEANMRLVIKLNNAATQMGRSNLDRLRALVEPHQAVTLVEQSLAYTDVLGMYASADAFVSLHRAEGLGLALLESMLLGTPVIATGYSGNLDFMSAENSLLVDYHLVDVAGSSGGSYTPDKAGEDQRWAEPDLEIAARHMVEIARRPELRRDLAAAALATATATQTNPQRGRAIDRLYELDEQRRLSSSVGRTNRLAAFEQGSPLYWRMRRMLGSRLRDLGLR